MYLRLAVLVLGFCATSVSASCRDLRACRADLERYYAFFNNEGIAGKFYDNYENMCRDTSTMGACVNAKLGSCSNSHIKRSATGSLAMRDYFCSDKGKTDLENVVGSESSCKNNDHLSEKMINIVADCKLAVQLKYAISKRSELGLSEEDLKGTKNSIRCRKERDEKNCYSSVVGECGKEVASFMDAMKTAAGLRINEKENISKECVK